MFLWLVSQAVAQLDFIDRPDLAQVHIGESIQRSGKGQDRTLSEDRQIGARWFDGRIRRPSDTVIWVSPGLTARWLGYLSIQDGWSDEELKQRWQRAETALHGRLTFIVRLAAMPKNDPLEFGAGSPAREQDLDNVKFQLRWQTSLAAPGKPYMRSGDSWMGASEGVRGAKIEKYDWPPILNRAFYSLTPLAPLFLSDGEKDELDDGVMVGDRFGAVYVVDFPIDSAMLPARRLEFDVIRKRRIERVFFPTSESD